MNRKAPCLVPSQGKRDVVYVPPNNRKKFKIPYCQCSNTDCTVMAPDEHQALRAGWEFEMVGDEVWQTPLRLAWAVTIHKSQGMSLDAAEIDLTKAFVPGMGYVALSRVRSLDGLYLVGLGPQALQMDRDIYEFDKALKQGRS